MAEQERYWDGLSGLALDASVIDPNDRSGHKNHYLAAMRDRSIIEALASIDRVGPILDLGCGTGSLTRALVADGRHVVAMDISQGLLGRSSERELGTAALFARFNGRDLPLRSGSVAAVTTYVVLNHVIGEGELPALLQEIRRVLAPGGIVVAIEQIRRRPRLDQAGWKLQRTYTQFVDAFTAAGLTVVGSDILRYGHFPTTYLVRWGWLPRTCAGALARLERSFARIRGIPLQDYCDVRFVLRGDQS